MHAGEPESQTHFSQNENSMNGVIRAMNVTVFDSFGSFECEQMP